MFIRDMKASKPTRFKEHLKQDAARKRKSYISIKDMTEKEKKQQRQKWAGSKKKQRNKKKGEELSHRNEGKKRFKDLSPEERKEYFKLKMKESREKMTRQKKTSVKEKDKRRKKSQTIPHTATCPEEEINSTAKQPDEDNNNEATQPNKVTSTKRPCEEDSSKTTFSRKRQKIIEAMPERHTATCPQEENNSTAKQPDEDVNNEPTQPNKVRSTKRPREEGSSTATLYRKRQKIIAAMPESPRSYADNRITHLWVARDSQKTARNEETRD